MSSYWADAWYSCANTVLLLLLQRTLCVLAANACLGVLTAFHLAYLGLMFDSSSDQDQVCPPLFTCALQSIMLLPWVF